MKKAIITDDSMVMRNCIRRVFEKRGFEVLEAKSGAELLSMYEKESPDIVTLDLNMPAMNGIETLASLKKRHPEAKVIVCTSEGERKVVIHCARIGIAGYFVKPIDMRKMNHCIYCRSNA